MFHCSPINWAPDEQIRENKIQVVKIALEANYISVITYITCQRMHSTEKYERLVNSEHTTRRVYPVYLSTAMVSLKLVSFERDSKKEILGLFNDAQES